MEMIRLIQLKACAEVDQSAGTEIDKTGDPILSAFFFNFRYGDTAGNPGRR